MSSLPPCQYDVHGSADVQSVDSEGRAVKSFSSGVRTAPRAVCNLERSRAEAGETDARTGNDSAEPSAKTTIESRRAREAWEAWKSAKPRPVKARDAYTRLVVAAWARLQADLGNAYSVGAVARACAVSEKTARQWRKGEQPIPPWAIAFLPVRLREAVLGIIEGPKGEMRKAVGE